MKLFKGKRLADGRIDWIDPQPLEHDLTPVDINQLNFYPPRYLDSLAKWGYDIKDKKFTDSLYYSLASCFEDSWIVVEDNLALGDHIYSTQENCSVNLAKIKAIWNEKFQNTILATREFEERLYWIHESKRSEALDLYINNLDLKLSEIDSMAALVIYGEARKPFLTFAARKDGKVKINATRSQQLRRYYEAKTKIFMDAVNKTNRSTGINKRSWIK